jgi:hypothetical protein
VTALRWRPIAADIQFHQTVVDQKPPRAILVRLEKSAVVDNAYNRKRIGVCGAGSRIGLKCIDSEAEPIFPQGLLVSIRPAEAATGEHAQK